MIQGLLCGDVNSIKTSDDFARLWVHECMRVFHDRLVDTIDKQWFMKSIESYTNRLLKLDWMTVNRSAVLCYVDFMNPGSDIKLYTEVTDIRKAVKIIEDYMDEYNATNTSHLKLVLFMDAVSHLTRICRIIRQPGGHGKHFLYV